MTSLLAVAPELVDAPTPPRRGRAEPLELEPELDPVDDIGGGGTIDVDDREPPEPPRRGGRGRGRPDRPPKWMRLLLYGAMLIACFTIGWAVGKIWRRIDKAAWGDEPLSGAWGS